MGSGQSVVDSSGEVPNSPTNTTSPADSAISNNNSKPITTSQQRSETEVKSTPSEEARDKIDTNLTKQEKRKKKEALSSYDQIEKRCAKKKAAYEKCYNQWWRNSFTAAKLEVSRDDCDNLFEDYQHCYLKGVKQVQQNRKASAGTAIESSALK